MSHTAGVPPAISISFADIEAAAERLRGVASRTPVITSRTVDALVGEGAHVFFKCENFQRGGAFKFRGAYNCLVQLSAAERKAGVIAVSSGNHAQGVAIAARDLGIHAVILMPTDAPATKLAATRAYGAEVVTFDRLIQDRDELAHELALARGLTFVPPYDHPHIMAGQGTAALELFEETGPLDLLLLPIGGGGLMSGCSIAAKALSPAGRIVGVETSTADDWVQSLAAGRIVRIPPPPTIADGMRTQQPGQLTFPIGRALLDSVLTVTDDEVRAAMRFLLLRLKLLVEPTGAVPAALLLSTRLGNLDGKRIGVILSGGNVDPETIAGVLREGA